MEILKFLYEVNTVNAYRVGWSRESVAGCLIHRRSLGYGDSIVITQETTIYRGESQNLVKKRNHAHTSQLLGGKLWKIK